MRKILLIACAFALSGCAWLGFGDDSSSVSATEPETMASEPAVEVDSEPEPAVKQDAKKAAKTTKAAKGKKSEEQIKAELDAMGKKIASQASRTRMPNRNNPKYRQAGNVWIAEFIDVNPNSVTTSMSPSKTPGQYTGKIYYQERVMECQGPTKQAAVSGDCKQVRSSNLTELIRYDGKAWQD